MDVLERTLGQRMNLQHGVELMTELGRCMGARPSDIFERISFNYLCGHANDAGVDQLQTTNSQGGELHRYLSTDATEADDGGTLECPT